jgi:hypothetical protein
MGKGASSRSDTGPGVGSRRPRNDDDDEIKRPGDAYPEVEPISGFESVLYNVLYTWINF